MNIIKYFVFSAVKRWSGFVVEMPGRRSFDLFLGEFVDSKRNLG